MLQFNVILDFLPYIVQGCSTTLTFTLVSLGCGLPLGMVLALFKIVPLRPLNYFAAAYTSIFRGTPLIVQLSLIFFGLPAITGYHFSPFAAGVFTFTLNSAAYTSEIIRSGLQSIDKGQWEAGHVLGLSKRQILCKIIFPQAFRVTLPALVNESIDLLKESALVSIIGEADLFRRAQIIASEKYLYFEPYLTVALCYYLMVLFLTFLARQLERKLKYA